MSKYTIDIETNNLLSNMLDFTSLPYKLNSEAKLYCIVIRNIETGEVSFAVEDDITTDWLKTTLADATEIILHNGIKFDLIALKLFGVLEYEVGYLDQEDKLFGKPVKIVDTLVRSRLLNPDRYGGHGLKAWGIALGEHKGDYTDFSHYNEEMLDYCITPDMRLLGEDLRWKPASEFSVGDNVLGFDENIASGRHGRRYKNANIEIITETDAEVFEVTLESGKVLKVTKEHRFLVSNNSQYTWVETKDLRTKETSPKYYSKLPCLLPVYEQDTSFDAGWMSGMLDGEGCLSNGKQRPHTLSVAQRPTGTLEKLERVFKKFEVNTSKRDVKTSTDCVSLRVTGGFSEVYRALCLFRPERLLAKVNFDSFGRLEMRGKSFNDGVVSVKSVGVQKILKIQTSARTFMCEGYPMHNCIQDTKVTTLIYKTLSEEYDNYEGWWKAEKLENKLADLAVKRETYGFWFNKELAIQCLEDLTEKMTELENKVNPILPPKPMNKTNLKKFTPPAVQFKKDRSFSSNFLKFVEKHNGVLGEDSVEFYGEKFSIPVDRPIKLYETANISDLDHVKMHLISLGWIPTEWKVRDLTKDTKKQSLTYEKRVETLDRWLNQTFDENKYKDLRLEELGLGFDKAALRRKLVEQLRDDKPVRVPTSPCVRVGVEKELCPNLVKLGDKVDFANDFTLFLTYKHRKSSIAGGDLEDVDYEDEYPNTGFLSMYRTVDGRIPTPSIEIGASTNRYRHIGVCNVARASSIYGKEMRSLFGCGQGMYQFGFDFSSLEARIQGHYILPFNGEELAEQLLASKPNDIHCYSEDTEILTQDGWKLFGDLTPKDKVAQYEDEVISFVKPLDIVWQEYEGDMYTDPKTQFKVTPNHRVLVKSFSSGENNIVRADAFKPSSDKRYIVGGRKTEGELNLSDAFIKLLVATQADGYLAKDCSSITYSFVKERKIERMERILDSLSADYTKKEFTRKGRAEVVFRLKASDLSVSVRDYLDHNKSFTNKLLNLNFKGLKTLLEEVKFWDGTARGNGDLVLDTTDKISCEFIQTVSALVGYKTNFSVYNKTTSYGDVTVYRVYVSTNTLAVKSANKPLEVSHYKGFIGCVSVPSGLVLVRRKGEIVVSGNTLNANKLGISRDQAKSISYALMYGASYKKLKSMLGLSDSEAKALYDAYWEAVKPLSDLRDEVVKVWKRRGSKYVIGIDGRKIMTRSQHSLLNALFQSGGVINAKYTTVFLFQYLEDRGYKCDPFVYEDLDCCGMIEYHDECQLAVKPSLIPLKKFNNEDELKEFVSNWKGKQLGAETTLKSGKICIALPNVISDAVQYGIDQAEKHTNLKVPLGYEFVTANNWYNCH